MPFTSGTVIAVAWIAALIVWLIGSMTTKATVRSQSGTSRLLELAPILIGVLILRGNRFLLRSLSARFVPATPLWQDIGVALTVAGVAFAIWSRFYLGRNWSAKVTVKEEHELIRTGPYSVVRHPIYSGFLLGILGTAVYSGQWNGLVALALILISWKIKTAREESFMESEFGEQYVQYRRDVKSLVPFVW